jgi:hypothetical protein
MPGTPIPGVVIVDSAGFDGERILPPQFYDASGTGEAVFGPCINCNLHFYYSAASVVTVRLKVPDMTPNPEPGEDSDTFPCCNACVRRANVARVARGDEPFPTSEMSSR